MCISLLLRSGNWSGCSVRALHTPKFRCTPDNEEHYEKVCEGMRALEDPEWEQGGRSTFHCSNGQWSHISQTLPEVSGLMQFWGQWSRCIARRRWEWTRGILFHGAAIRRLCCNFVLFCIFIYFFLVTGRLFFRQNPSKNSTLWNQERQAALVKGTEGCGYGGLVRIMVS